MGFVAFVTFVELLQSLSLILELLEFTECARRLSHRPETVNDVRLLRHKHSTDTRLLS